MNRKRKRCWLCWATVVFKRPYKETGCRRNGNTLFVGSGNMICTNRNRHQRVLAFVCACPKAISPEGRGRIEGILCRLHVFVEQHWLPPENTGQINFNFHSSEYFGTSSPLERCVGMDSEGAFRLSGKGYQLGRINSGIHEFSVGAAPEIKSQTSGPWSKCGLWEILFNPDGLLKKK